MAEVKCPMCGKPNPDDLDTCQFCDARLKPLIHPSPDDRAPLRPGDAPTKKDTAEFEGSDYRERLAGQASIAPGDAPTKKDTAELEHALPAWLRQARNPDRPLDDEPGEAKPDEGPAPASESGSAPASGLPDWLADLASGKESKVDTSELISGLTSAAGDESEVPGWLADLRGEDETAAFEAAPEPEESLPDTGGSDWLSRLGSESDSEEPSPAGETASTNWPSSLGGNATEEPVSEIPAVGQPEAGEETIDWLSQLQSEPESGEKPVDEDDDLPSWLGGLASETPDNEGTPAPQSEAEAPADESPPDWMKDLQAESAPEKPEARPDEESELPSWLGSLASETPDNEGTPAPQSEAEAPAEESPPDWMKDLQAEAQPAEEGELPSWLSGLSSESPGEEKPSAPSFEAEHPAEEGAPDWLKELQAEIRPAGEEELPSQLEDMPDWFNNLRAETAPQEPAPEEETPSWLGGLESAAPSEELPSMPAFETDVPPSGGETPEWLSSLKFEASEDLSEAEPEEPPARAAGAQTPAFSTGSLDIPDDSTPDWLANLQSPGTPPADEQAGVREETGEEIPSWLSSAEAERTAEEDESPSPFTAEDIEEAEVLPPWLSKAETEIAGESEDSQPLGTADVFAAGAPDWLSSVKPIDEERPAEAGVSTGPGEADLRPADLPNWVQAMRPVEDAMPDAAYALESERSELEQQGPLAGIAGILPAGVLPTGASRANTSRLQVTNTQQVNVGILEAILNAEARPREIKRAQGISSLRFLRWLAAIVLALTIGLVSGLGRTVTPTFSIPPEELTAVRNWVDAADLSAAPVLLVFDYEAALSGELDAAAAPVLDHLAIHGARLATLSTLPTGSALADRQMRTLQARHTYQPGQNYVSLGYLPGGPAGILAFAQHPASTGGESAWGTPVLADTRELTDFAAIFIITDSVETGQQWIEQTTDSRGSAQFFLVVSAQAEPMLRPYYQSGQVNGMVAGLAGGASYEANLNRPGAARRYWDAYSIGLLVSVILIVLGAGWSLVSTWISRPDKDEAK